jgi:glucose-6-phosphate 1-dehydrogenase
VVRGQFDGYRQEDGVAPGSDVETFAAVRVFIDNWRWQGVPIYLRAGKCMPMTATEVRVEFHRPPAVVFPNEQSLPHNFWRFLFSPRIEVGLNIQVKADGERMVGQGLELMAVDQSPDEMTPYERLIGDALRGDQTLFARQDVVEEAWRIVDPILGSKVPVHRYKPGTWGPEAANEILLPDGGWHAPQVDATT